MANGFNVTGLEDFTKAGTKIFLKETLFSPRMQRFEMMTNIQHTKLLNFLDAHPEIQAGICGVDAKGSTPIIDKKITVEEMSIRDEYCLSDLKDKNFPFEKGTGKGNMDTQARAALVASVANNVAVDIDALLWKGKVASGDLFDGWLTEALADSNAIAVTGTALIPSNIISKLDEICTAYPEVAYKRGLAYIHVSQTVFNSYKVALRTANLYHNVAGNKVSEMDIFGWEGQFKLIVERGLIGNKANALCTTDKNLVVGVDELGEVTELQLYFNPSTKKLEISAGWKLGNTYKYANEIVIYKA